MARVTTYLNFERETEEAFTFYKGIFGTEFEGEINRFGQIPPSEEFPPLPEEDKNLVMHMALPLFDGYIIRGSDTPPVMDTTITKGNNTYIHLEVDSKEQADSLYKGLTKDGEIEMELAEQFWGDYYGSFTDKFGVKWMISCPL